MMCVRHLMAIAALPFTVTVLIPIWISRRYDTGLVVGPNMLSVTTQVVGILVFGVGLLMFGVSLWHFAVQGRGTLAPWDPPKALVVGGPYRYVRNPMISGVLFVLVGQALVLLSRPHAIWALVFLCANLLVIPFFEEPQLEHRFGNSYLEYRRHVRRFVPRRRAWKPGDHH